MSEFRVDLDSIPFQQFLSDAAQKQFPFAISKAINKTAFQARPVVLKQVKDVMNIRTTWVPRRININPSTKRNLTAEIGSQDDFMVVQATGGIKTQRHETVVPAIAIRPTPQKRVTRSKFPRSLIAKGGRRKPFFLRGSRGTTRLVRQKRGRAQGLETLYNFPRRVRVEKRFELEKSVEQTMDSHWDRNMITSFDEALRTAK